MIEAHNLKKSFGPVQAVRDLSFSALDGAITGLLGSNGAGKSTTLRMICGVLKPDHGSVHVDKALGALLDHIGLYPRLTARENLAYFGQLRGIPPVQLAERIDQLISDLGMETIADRRTAGFSQGERMKTALARAILHSPQNLLLDEPTNGLDIPSVRALRGLLCQMRDRGMCIVLSSHVLEEVRILCDHVAIVCAGRVVGEGSPETLCRETDTTSLEDAFIKLTAAQEDVKCLTTL
jgi:sodium transport system ATP-binding protein